MAIMKGYGVIEPTVSWGWMEKEIPEPGPFEALCSPVAVLPLYFRCTQRTFPQRMAEPHPGSRRCGPR